ncbi:MAG: hypothetical protein KJ847_07320, partial [Firmicutes bacterium]|nr:hypothetical protein [Bacillota bacterium]
METTGGGYLRTPAGGRFFFGDGNVAGSISFMLSIADTNARALVMNAPEGGGTYVPILVWGDSTIYNKDLGWFNGKTEPGIAVVNDSATAYTLYSYNATTGQPQISYGGTANGLTIVGDFTVDSTLTTNLFNVDSIDANYADITDVITSMTIGGAYIYRAGGTNVPDADIASAATWNARLDSAIILVWSDTTGVIVTVSDTTVLSDRISGKADSGAVLYLAQDETITGEPTFDSDTLKFTNLSTVFYFDSIMTLYSKATTPANGFVEFVSSDGSGRYIIGRTSATAPSTVAITDGEADNEPGYLQLYKDDGNASHFWVASNGELRMKNGAYADDDADGYVIMDEGDGTIGATTQPVKGSVITAATSFDIGANSLTTTEFGYLDGINQTVATTSSPTFVAAILSG